MILWRREMRCLITGGSRGRLRFLGWFHIRIPATSQGLLLGNIELNITLVSIVMSIRPEERADARSAKMGERANGEQGVDHPVRSATIQGLWPSEAVRQLIAQVEAFGLGVESAKVMD